MNNYSTIPVNGRVHVVRQVSRNSHQHRDPNYRDTGLALCGVLEVGETLGEWIARKKKRERERDQLL